jgi:NAD(P)-dependent dehydrogenase (short-subunit alcohol dehydrogenase family)
MRTPQTPINSGFSSVTAAREVVRGVDLSGQIAIVTGGYAGIGLETTRALHEAGATVVVPARNAIKAQQAVADLIRVEVASLDLMRPSSIDAFAAAFLASGRPLHMLINNAGIMAPPLERNERGWESQWATNHLGHFQLTIRLWPSLARAGCARVVSLSSRAHQWAGVDLSDPNYEHRPYDRWQAYAQSKSANVLFAVSLDARAVGHGVRAFAVHPGLILTDLGRHMTDEEVVGYGLQRTDLGKGQAPKGRSVNDGGEFKDTEQGAATSVWCATSTRLHGLGGVYCEDVDIAVILQDPAGKLQARDEGSTGHDGVAAHAIDWQTAERLWSLSEQLTGARFSG